MIYLWASLLFLSNLLAWGSNFFGVPGNWLLLLFTIVYKLVLPPDQTPDLSWTILLMALVMAIFGEIWEFAASAAGAAKKGGSRRGAIMSIVGSLVGSIGGAVIGVPVPVIGPLLGALVGGAVGAFAGAYFGERDRKHGDRVAIGKAALVGRLFGTAGKLVFGLVMLIIVTADSFADF
ncbi:DUF456 domain-containing protein [Planctomicrobium piriforme]|uniref:DUF456 domain-containing protein n=1 Tax=Planctomicrobium piriforme TaxID=1576369 RepID=A0A1I3E9L8_9PLAN|nr:DUF456 domain-containing protein [Planctomicrobium piriforme]SFH95654.1 hypothetical protein SAMN05421753_104132 [Planctomicrobium piriforme]